MAGIKGPFHGSERHKNSSVPAVSRHKCCSITAVSIGNFPPKITFYALLPTIQNGKILQLCYTIFCVEVGSKYFRLFWTDFILFLNYYSGLKFEIEYFPWMSIILCIDGSWKYMGRKLHGNTLCTLQHC